MRKTENQDGKGDGTEWCNIGNNGGRINIYNFRRIVMKKRVLRIVAVVLAFAFLVGGAEIANNDARVYASSIPTPKYYFGDSMEFDGSGYKTLSIGKLGKSYTIVFSVKANSNVAEFVSLFLAGRDLRNHQSDDYRWLSITKRIFSGNDGEIGGCPLVMSLAKNGASYSIPGYWYQDKTGAMTYNDVITPKNGWKQIVLTVDGNVKAGYGEKGTSEYYEGVRATTYVDGQFFGTGCVVSDIYNSDKTETYLGGNPLGDNPLSPPDAGFKGYIDEVAFYAQSVSADQAKEIYKQGVNGGVSTTQKPSSGQTVSNGNTTVKSLSKVSSLKLKAKKKAFTASWKKVKNATKYQIQYAVSKKKVEKAKKKSVTKTSVTIKGLKKKKTYYVRVRAYTKNGKTTVYGKWSSVKKIKIKK